MSIENYYVYMFSLKYREWAWTGGKGNRKKEGTKATAAKCPKQGGTQEVEHSI